jgi:hypothetical protein
MRGKEAAQSIKVSGCSLSGPLSSRTASQKVHLRRCASSFVIAAYVYVLLIPQDSRALHLELFTVPSALATFYEPVK